LRVLPVAVRVVLGQKIRGVVLRALAAHADEAEGDPLRRRNGPEHPPGHQHRRRRCGNGTVWFPEQQGKLSQVQRDFLESALAFYREFSEDGTHA
jgi:hypothetical protein